MGSPIMDIHILALEAVHHNKVAVVPVGDTGELPFFLQHLC